MAKTWKVQKADAAVIRKLSRDSVEQTLAKLDPFITKRRWLAKTNRYSINTVERLALDLKPGKRLHAKQLAQYIAASSILHCADGWSYFGRAINCLLKGDPHRVVHLAYYAELRAALSLLASEAIGVFNRIHFVVDAPDSARRLSRTPGTHVAAWAYLKYWSSLKRSGRLFSDIISPAGIPLTEWFEDIGGVEQFVHPKARAWFNQWSMDLGLFAEDREARNESSYRPDGIPISWRLSATESLSLATELWEACEPSPTSLFDGIDRHILRMTAESAFTGTTGTTPAQDSAGFAAFVASLVDPQALDDAVANHWKGFLSRQSAPDDPKLFGYAKKDPLDRTVGHAAVLARALLLLRVAAGSSLRLIRSAGVSSEKLKFWWSELGVSRGIWDGAKDRADLLDLWEDIIALFEDIRDFRTSTPAPEQTFQVISNKIPQVVAGLGGCERVAIWSLTP
jgi:hypothetical protein